MHAVDLLGLHRPLPDDRDRGDRRGRPDGDSARGSASQGWFAAPRRPILPCWCCVGVATAVAIRKLRARRRGSRAATSARPTLILALIAGVVLTLLLWHAARIAAGLNEWPAALVTRLRRRSRTSSAAATRPESASGSSCGRTWSIVVLGFLVYLPATRSTCTSRPPRRTSSSAARGGSAGLEPLRFDVAEDELRFGAGTVADLTWKEVLDVVSCTECGRCQDACPAWATGKALSPKLLVMGLRDQLLAEGQASLDGGELTP